MNFILSNGLKRRRHYVFIVTLALIIDLALSQKAVEDRDFTIDEFYDIKKSVKSLQLKKASYVLEHERVKSKKLFRSLPKAPRFYGQDHFEQSYDRTGKEIWTHVGRPDELIYDMFFKTPSKVNGTFIEVGAADGVRASNTLFFEESLGWSGLLIEGATENFLKLFAEHRRKASVKTFSAICDTKRETKFVGDGLAAGAVEDMTRHHIESWGRHFKSLSIYEVPCDRMSTLTQRAKIPRVVDLLSIDIEGGEYRALSTFDWTSHNVRVVVIEPGKSCYVDNKKSQNKCADLLRKEGFCLVARRAVNEYWVSDPNFKQAYCVS